MCIYNILLLFIYRMEMTDRLKHGLENIIKFPTS